MRGKAANFVVYIILGLLVFALAGFGIGNFGGSVGSVLKVGDTEVTTEEYFRALQQELSATSAQLGRNVTLEEARLFGIDRQVLSGLVAQAALDEEADRLGISIGDARVRDEIVRIPAFAGLDGNFDRQSYELTLQQNNLRAAEFEDNVRADAARTLLQTAIVGGIAAPDNYGETLYTYIGERRSFWWVRLDEGDLDAPLPAPTEDDLRSYYEANPIEFTLPESREITYVHLSPEMMVDQLDVSDDDLRALYDQRADVYILPERRIVDRLVFGTEAEALEAKERVESRRASFDLIIEERGLTLEDVDQGEVTREDLADNGDAVFALEDTGVVGPLPTSLGPALFRVNAILLAQETSFEDAREELLEDWAGDAARRAIRAEIDPLDDLLAGGATLEELADESPAELGTISLTADSTEGLAAYPTFRSVAFSVTEGSFPELGELQDGGLFALRLDEIRAPQLQPLEDVRDQVEAGWRQQAIREALTAQTETTIAALDAGQTVADLSLSATAEGPLTRDSFLEGVPPTLVADVFAIAEAGTATTVEGVDGIYLVRLEEILPPDPEDPEADLLRSILAQNVSQGIAQDIFNAYATAVQQSAGLEIDQTAINAVEAQFP